jgi:hypothetical protein
MLRAAAFTIAWTLALAGPAPSAVLADAGTRARRACDTTQELEAAKRAAAAGDQAAAVEHLLRADAILATCQEDPAEASPTLRPESPERAIAHGSGPVGSLGRG